MLYMLTLSMFIFLYPVLRNYQVNLASIVAESSQRFIKQNKLCNNQFAWQESASAFSVSKPDVDKVCKYILNQPEHHRKISFAEEYEEFINFTQKPCTLLKRVSQNKVIRLRNSDNHLSTRLTDLSACIEISKPNMVLKYFGFQPDLNTSKYELLSLPQSG